MLSMRSQILLLVACVALMGVVLYLVGATVVEVVAQLRAALP